MRCALVLALLLGAVPAQQAVQQDVQARLDAAQEQLEAGAAEAAARALRALRADVSALDAAAQKRLLPGVETLLAKADPDDAAAQKELEPGARKLLEVARAYTGRKWHRAALRWCELAAETHGKAAAAALGAARAQARDRTVVPDGDGIAAWFGDGESIYAAEGKWSFADDVAVSPKLGDETMAWRSRRATGASYRVDVEMVAGSAPAKIALAIGLRDAGTDYGGLLVELDHGDGDSALRLFHLVKGAAVQLVGHPVQLTRAERDDFLPIWVCVEGNRVRAGIADLEEVEIQAPVRDLGGWLALFVSGNSPNKAPVRWRGLRVRPL